MQRVFNVLFICLFICIVVKRISASPGLSFLPGLFAQSVLRQPPLLWPPSYHSPDELATANLQQSESNGRLLSSAEHHMISSEEPIPSGIFIPIGLNDQLHRELFNSPHLIRKHSASHYPYQSFNHFHHHPTKKLIASSKHYHHKAHPSSNNKFVKSFNKNQVASKKKNQHHHDYDKFYVDEDFYSRHSNLFNKLNGGQLLPEYADYNQYNQQELELGKNGWQKSKLNTDQDQTNTLINTTEEHLDQDEDDLFTVKNSNELSNLAAAAKQQQQQQKQHNNGRIDLRKSNKRKYPKDSMKDLKEYRDTKDIREFKEFKEMKDERREMRNQKELRDAKESKDLKLTNENRYFDNYDNRNNNQPNKDVINEKFNENRNIERYNLEKFFNLEKMNEDRHHNHANRNDGRILIKNQNEKSIFKNYKNPNSGELSVISETIYQNHQNLLKNGKEWSIF